MRNFETHFFIRDIRMKGLLNFGNTCYFNSAVQCLLQVPQLSNYFLRTGSESDFSRVYKTLVHHMWQGDQTEPGDTRVLMVLVQNRFPQFRGLDQQDSQELFVCLLDMFSEQDLISALFKGRTVQETRCSSGVSNKFEDTMSLVLYPSMSGTVSWCLHEYQNYQNILGYTDNQGVTHNVGISRNKFWVVPRVLVLCFQNKKNITIEDEIYMGQLIHSDSTFPRGSKKLFGLIYHHGSQDCGHYIAFVKHLDKWYLKDDHIVKEMVPPKEAPYYMAFYL
jgi:ubiquitin C-terminal hydrolase